MIDEKDCERVALNTPDLVEERRLMRKAQSARYQKLARDRLREFRVAAGRTEDGTRDIPRGLTRNRT